jgi:hypothetical protein
MGLFSACHAKAAPKTNDVSRQSRDHADAATESRMHTLTIVMAGLVLLGLFLVGGYLSDGAVSTAARIFIPVWLVASLVNLWIGVSRAGYTVQEEVPILFIVFGIPAAIAAAVAWRVGRG